MAKVLPMKEEVYPQKNDKKSVRFHGPEPRATACAPTRCPSRSWASAPSRSSGSCPLLSHSAHGDGRS
jgi:hypothetical protein